MSDGGEVGLLHGADLFTEFFDDLFGIRLGHFAARFVLGIVFLGERNDRIVIGHLQRRFDLAGVLDHSVIVLMEVGKVVL